MNPVYIEADRRRWFRDGCSKSRNGHRVVNMFREVPHLGCLHCGRRNKKVELKGEQLYHFMVATGAAAKDAFEASGYLPARSKARALLNGRTGSGNGTNE